MPVLPAVPAAEVRALVAPTGVVVPVRAQAPGGWLVTTPCGYSTVLTKGVTVGSADVVLDAGHGGDESGAIGPNGLREKDVNLGVVKAADAALGRAGFRVLETRTGDYRVTLATRAEVATRVRPRVFLSVHHNAEPDGPRNGPGTETYYQVASADSKRLAGLVYEEVVRALSQYRVAWVADTDAGAKWRTNDRGQDYYGILRRSAGVTAVLGELAFVTNPPEADLLARPDVQQVEGEAVARGIVRYLTTRDPGSGYTTPYPRTTPAGPGGGERGCRDPALG